MPRSALRQCSRSGCRSLVRGATRCDAHRVSETRVGSYAQRSGVKRKEWDFIRQAFLAENRFCAEHLKRKPPEHVEATVVDHIVAHRGDLEAFFDHENLQALCAPCHSRKTVNVDGGFGR